MLDFSVSCSPLGIPQKIIAAWPELLSEVKRYPSVEGSGVQHFYATRYGIGPDRLIAGNGSIDCIYALADLLRPTRATVLAPCFADYRRSLKGRGTQVAEHILHAKDDWVLPSDDLPNPGQLVWLASPGNPTAAQWQQERLLKLAQNLAKRGAMLVVDEAFIDLVPDAQNRSLLRQKNLPENLVILHSLTKSWGIPGLRLGAMICHPTLQQRLAALRPPWMIAGPADQAARLLAEDDGGHLKATRAFIHPEMERLRTALAGIPGLEAFPSRINFLLVKVSCQDPDEFLNTLMQKHQVNVRDCRSFAGLSDFHIRIGLRSSGDNDRLIAALNDAMRIQ